MTRRPIVSVIGDASVSHDDPRYGSAMELGGALVGAGYRIVCGGLSGIMEAVCRGARESPMHHDGDTIGILPCWDPDEANPYVDIPIATGLDMARNVLVANTDAVIAVGGGSGTLSEMAHAWALGRLVIAYRVEGVSGVYADRPLDHRERYPEIPDDRVYGVDDAEGAIEALRLAPSYAKRHESIISVHKRICQTGGEGL